MERPKRIVRSAGRGSPADTTGEFFLDRGHQSWPYIRRAGAKVPPRLRIVGQKLHVAAPSLAGVAGETGSDNVPRRLVASTHSGLYMVHAQGVERSGSPAVHALPLVAVEHGETARVHGPGRRMGFGIRRIFPDVRRFGAARSASLRLACCQLPSTLLPLFARVIPRHRSSGVKIPDPMRRQLMTQLTRFLDPNEAVTETAGDLPPRLTHTALEALRMSRSRDRILTNLEEMYTEAFARAKESGDDAQMASLDFAYRREQLYFEILLDVRDAIEKR